MADTKKITTSLCLPENVDDRLEDIAFELKVSKSAVATAMLSILIKWTSSLDIEEVISNGKR